jgi:TonB family protein
MKQSEAFSQASRQAAPSAPRLSEEAAGGGALTREAPAPAMEKMADTEELNPNQASPVQAGGAQIVQAKPADGPAKNTARSGDDQPGRSSEVTEKTDALALADKKRKAVEAEAKSENGINPGVLTPFSPNYSAAPADGSVAFTNYLKKNLHYPVAALEKKMEGTVVVEFIVATDGSMTGFKAVQKLGLGCDEEAIRLVQFGPRWKPAKQGANPISSTARVDVEFSIPK